MNIDEVVSDAMIREALHHIRRKKGVPGTDKMKADELWQYWEENGSSIITKIRNSSYNPQPVLQCLVSKEGTSEKRKIEIPCVIDRMLLYAIHATLTPYYETCFSRNSYGFRDGMGCHDALRACLDQLNHGARYIVDLDIRHFFDTVNHRLLFRQLEQDIEDPRLLSLIKKYVQTKVICGRHVFYKRVGLPQGSAISPLFANIYLNTFDRFMDAHGLHFIRYADDILIFCSSYTEARQCLSTAESFLAEKLHLHLNEEKTKIVRPWELEYLGYSFAKNGPDRYVFALNSNIKKKMLSHMKKHMNRIYRTPETWWERMGGYNRGWINYYKYIDANSLIPFLYQAEQIQLAYFSDLFHAKDESCRYVNALFNCKNFSSLTGWYKGNIIQEDSFLLRRMDTMSDKYTYWRSSGFYEHKKHLRNVYDTIVDKPYYYSGQYYLGLSCLEGHAPADTSPPLTDLQLLIVGILAAGKNMTLLQLNAYLTLQGTGIEPEKLHAILEALIHRGIIKKHTIYQKGMSIRELRKKDPSYLSCYQVSSFGYEYAKDICAPLDYRIKDEYMKSDRYLLYYYTSTILWNQIILNFILYHPGFQRYQIATTYNVPNYGKLDLPLYIATSRRNYYFCYLRNVSESNIHISFIKWMTYQKHISRKVDLVILSDTFEDMHRAKRLFQKELSAQQRYLTDKISFSVIHSWYHTGPGIILPYKDIT